MKTCECCGQTIKTGSMTDSQRGALHLYLTWVAKGMNDAGFDVRTVLEMRPKLEIPWTMLMVKENMYKPILLSMEGKASTEQMDTVEPGDVYKVMDRFTSDNFGISYPWPSKETLYLQAMGRVKR